MTRISELQKKYHRVPRDVIVKWDTIIAGVRDTTDHDKLSSWKRPRGSYQSYDEDLTLARIQEETPWRVKDNAVLMPDRLFQRSGLGITNRRKVGGLYTIRELSEGRFVLFEDEQMLDVDIYHYYSPPLKQRQGSELVTSKGTLATDIVEMINPRCYKILPVRFCEYFTSGDQCRFCNFNPTQEDARSVGLKRSTTINAEDAAEAFKIIGSEVRLIEGLLESGGFARTEALASVNLRFVDKLSNSLPYTTHMKIIGEAMSRRELLRLKDAGLSGIRFAMETFDERLFPVIAPGKAKRLSRDGWLEAFQQAVDIFGAGSVETVFVGAVTLQGPQGYDTWQEARDSHIEGQNWMISHGVFPVTTPLRWAPGSPFSQDPANREKFPPTEFYLDLAVACDKTMKEYGLYEKLNKFLECGLKCHTHTLSGEIGILEKAGDYGKWMSDVVPYEQNWLAQFLDSIRSSEEKQ